MITEVINTCNRQDISSTSCLILNILIAIVAQLSALRLYSTQTQFLKHPLYKVIGHLIFNTKSISTF